MSCPSWVRARGLRIAALLVAFPLATAAAPPPESAPAEGRSPRALLDAAREDLVGLRFEQALAAIESLLGRTDLAAAEREEALVLRSQAHVASGNLEAAERDYREILTGRPGFTPDPGLTPSKALERFHRVRAALVGELVIDVQPPDARITVDGLETTVPADAKLPLVAAEHVIRAERRGFDPLARSVRVEANQSTRVELRLLPNARTIIVQTEPEDVEVSVDGVPVGRTARAMTGGGSGTRAAAQFTIESLPLGEHVIELSKPCFRRETIRDFLAVDLSDWSPKVYPPVRLAPARSTIVLRGGPVGAEVFVDGEPMALLPATPIEVCPGERQIEVWQSGRRLWTSVQSLAQASEAVVVVEPRPNVAFFGAAEWPLEIAPVAERFNATAEVPLRTGLDLSRAEGWDGLRLAPDLDLALVARDPPGDAAGWWIYSPLLRAVAALDAIPASLEPPRLSGVSWGLSVVDSTRSGPALVAEVRPDRSATAVGLRPGDRLVSLGGTHIESAAQAQRILSIASAAVPLDVEWLSADGTARRGRLAGEPSWRLIVDGATGVEALLRAAWASVLAVADQQQGAAATANLALLLGAHGRSELAVQVWRRVELDDRPGIGSGTVQYYLGCELERLGAKEEALRAYRLAASSAATAFEDEGPAIAPAARDRLADLELQ